MLPRPNLNPLRTLPVFWLALLSVVLSFSLGMVLASILQWPHLKGKATYRILLILPYAAVTGAIVLSQRRGLDVLTVGDEEAAGLGLHPQRSRYLLLIAASLGDGMAVEGRPDEETQRQPVVARRIGAVDGGEPVLQRARAVRELCREILVPALREHPGEHRVHQGVLRPRIGKHPPHLLFERSRLRQFTVLRRGQQGVIRHT